MYTRTNKIHLLVSKKYHYELLPTTWGHFITEKLQYNEVVWKLKDGTM